jgi:hypothetical protein
MTVWNARRAKSGDTRRILCGRIVDGQYTCPEVIAWMAADGTATDYVFALPGLTESGTSGHWRWSSHARRRMQGGHTREPPLAEGRRIREAMRVILPATLPCRKQHENRVDSALLLV